MATESTIINVLTDTFVKFATRENLKKFCNDNVIDFNDSSFTKDRIFSLPVLLGLILYPKAHSLFIDEMAYLEGIGSSIASAAAFAWSPIFIAPGLHLERTCVTCLRWFDLFHAEHTEDEEIFFGWKKNGT